MELVGGSYWCYRCRRYMRGEEVVNCPDCGGGFPAASMYLGGGVRRSPFNPVIVLRDSSNLELFYDHGAGSGLRPLPPTMSHFLMGSGFDRLLDHLDINAAAAAAAADARPPASKSAIESMPVVHIGAGHVSAESHCAVCKEAFDLGAHAREMPCNHIYHSDCILPWLSLRNSCPVCRHQLPTSDHDRATSPGDEDDSVGLTIWRLPGGGFAVGRFTGGRRAAAERELPLVFTELDGGFNTSSSSSGDAPTRTSSGGGRARERGRRTGVGRTFRRFFSFFGRSLTRSSRSTLESDGSIFGGSSRHRSWALDHN